MEVGFYNTTFLIILDLRFLLLPIVFYNPILSTWH